MNSQDLLNNIAYSRAIQEIGDKSLSSCQKPRINTSWLRGAVFCFAIATGLLICGLVICVLIGIKGFFVSDSLVGPVAAYLMIASFVLFFVGASFIDKAYEPIYKSARPRQRITREI